MESYDSSDAIEQAWREGLRPDPLLTVSEWADRYRVLSQRASSEPGRWRTARTPYLKEIMDCLSPASSVQRVVFMKGSQTGGTEAGNNFLGYVIHQAPGPIMAVAPTVELAKRNSRQRMEPLIEESPALRELGRPARSRDSGNTQLSKDFPGGVLIMTGANSAVGLRSMPAGHLFLDEVDAYPASADEEGDPGGGWPRRARSRRQSARSSRARCTGPERDEGVHPVRNGTVPRPAVRFDGGRIVGAMPGRIAGRIGYYGIRPPIKPVPLHELAALPQTDAAIIAVAGFAEGPSSEEAMANTAANTMDRPGRKQVGSRLSRCDGGDSVKLEEVPVMQPGNGHHRSCRPCLAEHRSIDGIKERPVLYAGDIGGHLQNSFRRTAGLFHDREQIGDRATRLILETCRGIVSAIGRDRELARDIDEALVHRGLHVVPGRNRCPVGQDRHHIIVTHHGRHQPANRGQLAMIVSLPARTTR
jgi:hypothetical protein